MTEKAATRGAADEFDQTILSQHMRRRVGLPCAIFALCFVLYSLCVAGALLTAAPATKILLAVLAGVFIANLAIIGHDAVHRSFTSSRWLNRAIGTLAFLPALHPFGRWEHNHNRVHHRYTAQIGVDNAYSPMTIEQYREASPRHRLYYRFMRSLAGQPFFYMIDIWLPKMFLPNRAEGSTFRDSDWIDLAIVRLWLVGSVVGLAFVSRIFGTSENFAAALVDAAVYGFLIPFLVWNVFIAFVTIVQHTGPNVRWVMPTGRPSTHTEKLNGTVHLLFPEPIDWFFHRVMQHLAHHVNPMVPLYSLKGAENAVIAHDSERAIVERWTPLYHWRLARDCKLYDPVADRWCGFDFQPTRRYAAHGQALSIR